ncbi:MAG TPA: glycosyltransferase family 2 protein [Prolixibacteraceae bacterium]|nr:glycosyltransferase family 2 protein [Prolixibacteraceae bacterium]
MSINFSVIIPHRNTPELLIRCLNSIPNRNDLQVIVVDDNSDDNIVDFSSFPFSNNSGQYVVLSKEGKGAGYARNIGLGLAIGKWIIFADADDFFSTDFGKALDAYSNNDSDIIFFRSNSLPPDTRSESLNQIIDRAMISGDLNELRYKFVSPCCKFLKKSFLDKYTIRFQESEFGNDVLFSVSSGHFASKIDISEMLIYTITHNEKSLTKKVSLQAYLTRYDVTCQIFDFLKKVSKQRYGDENLIEWWFRIRKLDVNKSLELLPGLIQKVGRSDQLVRLWLRLFNESNSDALKALKYIFKVCNPILFLKDIIVNKILGTINGCPRLKL